MLNNARMLELLSWQGRINRREFWKTYFMFLVLEFFIGLLARITASTLLAWLLWSLYVFFALIILFLVIKRLHDIGKSGWWALFFAIPLANLYAAYLVFIKRSKV